MSISLELTPGDIDLIFLALQEAPVPVSYSQINTLIRKIDEQGRPQLLSQATLVDEEIKVGGTD